MSAVSQLDSDFVFAGADETATAAPTGDPLGPLADLPGPGDTPGTWVGHGFNAIWRPHRLTSGQDRFLELNLTDDKLVFARINGEIPNRGLDMPDINMHGVTYMQQINEAGNPADGLHIEPGIWALVPQTTDPAEPQTVVRMASIPHGTVINAQGIFQVVAGGPQNIPDNNILPFFFNTPATHQRPIRSGGVDVPGARPLYPDAVSPGTLWPLTGRSAEHRQKSQQRPSERAARIAPGDQHDDAGRSCTSRPPTASSRVAAGPPIPLF